ncbi:FAD-binding oxidoreductase [Leeia sp. TBRC 13508]|uniref:FAD-binding oxidoreductase n=1 Tax=Leeia speluncae TaxID=2884804 RepID=A0ABS8D8S8_9NEIS|nr:FAD-binding oxidoreductase [Leeia speluncae]MCB6184527.1 FAD-binding oxidoreductase [Leeia speluncae]
MLGDKRSHGLWEASAPLPPETHALNQDLVVDVAIIGGGFTGCSAALHLAKRGMQVAVLEGNEIGFGGSGRNVGLVNAGMWVQPEDVMKELGEVYGNRLLTQLGAGPAYVYELVKHYEMQCEAVPNGTLHCAVGQSGLADIKAREKQWKALGAPVEVLSQEETAKRTGTDAYTGALLDKRAGTIQPLAYVRGLAKAAIKEGASLYSNTRVKRYSETGETYEVETENGYKIKAKWVVLATNAYSAEAWNLPKLREELVHLPYFNFATKPLNAEQKAKLLPGREGVWDTCEILTSYRYDQQDRLVFGSVGALRGMGASIHKEWAKRAMYKLFPYLKGVEFDYEWFGMIGMTPNALPRFHMPSKQVISFSGYNGRGISPGTVFGREIAKLILGDLDAKDMPLPLSTIDEASFRSVKEMYYEVGAQVAHAATARF